MKKAYVTAISTDSYLPGVLALDKNIRDTCKYPLVVLVPHDLSEESYEKMRRLNIKFVQADHIETPKELMRATEEHDWFAHWAKSLFKLRIFDLVEYDKIVFVDCDMMLMESVDEVFDLPDISATIGAKDYPGNEHFEDLSSGFMVIEPKKGLSDNMALLIPEVAAKKNIFGDQDIMQAYFTDWKEKKELVLPDKYNVWFPHYQFYAKRERVKGVHFLGRKKPWMMNNCDVLREYLRCLFKGNRKGIAVLRKYRKLLKEVGSNI